MSAIQPQQEPATLVGLLDGLIDGGVHVSGDLVIGLADVELLRVALRLLVASEDTVQRTGVQPAGVPDHPGTPATTPASEAPPDAAPPRTAGPGIGRRPTPRAGGTAVRSRSHPRPSSIEDADREQLVRGISQLVLTVVEVLRELLERQAIRRVEAGSLTDDQVERLGIALAALEDRMGELKEVFGVTDDDLNLDLGPLGRLR